MAKYRIVKDNNELWHAEEKTSFGWERIMWTFGRTEEDSLHQLKKERQDA